MFSRPADVSLGELECGCLLYPFGESYSNRIEYHTRKSHISIPIQRLPLSAIAVYCPPMSRYSPPPPLHHSRWLHRLAKLAVVASLAALVVVGCMRVARAATDFTQSVTQLNASQSQVSFTPTTP